MRFCSVHFAIAAVCCAMMSVMPFPATAKETFHVKDASGYSLVLTVESKDENGYCSGKGTVELRDAKGTLIQTFSSDDLCMDIGNASTASAGAVELGGGQSPVIIDDFNFDGSKDIAIRNGNDSGYGGPSYDIHVWNLTKKAFVKSDELTALAHENLGMFQVDAKRKRLITFAKSGCCWHKTSEYEVRPGKGLQLVREFTEDAMDGKTVILTERQLVNGVWKTKTEKKSVSEYYK